MQENRSISSTARTEIQLPSSYFRKSSGTIKVQISRKSMQGSRHSVELSVAQSEIRVVFAELRNFWKCRETGQILLQWVISGDAKTLEFLIIHLNTRESN